MMKEHYKHPRLYLKDPLHENAVLSLSAEQAHYLKNVLRKSVGDVVRLFNGQQGEWLGRLSALDKRAASVEVYDCIRQQPAAQSSVHLYFAPIKKQRMDILIEKAVELGVDEFHPVITNRTENRKLNEERITAQVFEAAEQCERLEIPVLHAAEALPQVLRKVRAYPLFACLERGEAAPLRTHELPSELGFLVGPEGGFDDGEIALIQKEGLKSVSLGEAVLRAETASISCLAYMMLAKQP